MRNIFSLVLIFGICIVGVVERFQNKVDGQVAAMDAVPAQAVLGGGGRKIYPEESKAASAGADGLSHALDSTVTSAEPLPMQSLSRSNVPEMPPVQWHEAESFLRYMEKQAHDLEAEDVDKFNALIREARRITRGLPPELRQQFKDELFVIIDTTFELPPLPKGIVYEFEKE